MSYLGNSTVAIDAKGRTSLPRELRRGLPEAAKGEIVLFPGADHELQLLDKPSFDAMLRGLGKQPRTSQLAQFISTMTFYSVHCTLDEQNRITLTPELMKMAGLKNRVTFYGAGDRIKLIEPARAEAKFALAPELPADFSEFLDTLEIPTEGF